MSRRFDIGPIVLALGALLVLVGLFLAWYVAPSGVQAVANANLDLSAWDAFELADILLAALAIAGIVCAAGLLLPDAEYLDRRALPWIVGATFIVVAIELVNKPPVASGRDLGTGAWMSFAGAVIMVIGATLSLTRVSFAVAVEGRDRRRRVATVDHRPPPTETGAPVARSSESLLHPRPEPPEVAEET